MPDELRFPTGIRVAAGLKALLGLPLLSLGLLFGWVGLRHLLWGEPRAAPIAWLFALPFGLLGYCGLRDVGSVLWRVEIDDRGLGLHRLGRSHRVHWADVVGLEHRPGFTITAPRLRIRTRQRSFILAKSLPGYRTLWARLREVLGEEAFGRSVGTDRSPGGSDSAAGAGPAGPTEGQARRSGAPDPAAGPGLAGTDEHELPLRFEGRLPPPDRIALLWLLSLPVVGLVYAVLEPGEGFLLPALLLGGLMAAVLIVAVLFKTRGLVVDTDGLRRSAPLWTTEIPLEQINEVRLERAPAPLVWTLGIPAFGGKRLSLVVDHGYGVIGSDLALSSGTLDAPVEEVWERVARCWPDRGSVAEPYVWRPNGEAPDSG